MNVRTVQWILRCPTCGPMLLVIQEDYPMVYRFCPKCGERKLVEDGRTTQLIEHRRFYRGGEETSLEATIFEFRSKPKS